MPLTGPRSTSSALKTTSLYQAEKSSLWAVTPRSSRATRRGYGIGRAASHALIPGTNGPRQVFLALVESLSFRPGLAVRALWQTAPHDRWGRESRPAALLAGRPGSSAVEARWAV